MKKQVKEGLGELAHAAERDHEVQMARAELYKLAKYSIKLHDMLKGVSETEGLEGWVQSKITKAAADIGSVYHHLDYQEAEAKMPGLTAESKKVLPERGSRTKKNKKANEYKESLRTKLDTMLEKKLTPAEKKKREEVATAIKKDNPKMPMGKKMAIATATAKKSA